VCEYRPIEKVDNMDENIIYIAKPSTKNAKTRTIDPETFEKINALLQTEKEEVK
jgi:hypothetical protein